MNKPEIELGDWIVLAHGPKRKGAEGGDLLRTQWAYARVGSITESAYRLTDAASPADTMLPRLAQRRSVFGPFLSRGEAKQTADSLNNLSSEYREAQRTLIPKFEHRMKALLDTYRPDGEE